MFAFMSKNKNDFRFNLENKTIFASTSLLEDKLVAVGETDHLVVLLQILRLEARLPLRPLQSHHSYR
jgi:hypothetical protein